MRILSAFLLGSTALLALSPAHAAESYANCNGVITSVPKTISTPGVWCVKQDLSTSSASAKAINITADNVTLDCNDFTISGAGGAADTSIGIYTNDHLNVTVRHCNVQGFRYGLHFHSTVSGGGHIVEDNSFSANSSTGIRVDGDGSVIRRNQVINTGGSTSVGSAWGIYGSGAVGISDNTVAGVAARAGGGGNAYGIYLAANSVGAVEGNRVRGLAKDGAGAIFGVYDASTGRVAIRKNQLFGDAGAGSTGVYCPGAAGRVKDNMFNGFATALGGCTDASGNDVAP